MDGHILEWHVRCSKSFERVSDCGVRTLRFPSADRAAVFTMSKMPAGRIGSEVAMFEIHRWRVASFVMAGLLSLMLASQAGPQPPTVQEPPLVIEGRVFWVDFGGQTMLLNPADGGLPIMVDLHRIRQSDYSGFRGNEFVRVVGFLIRPNRRLQAYQLYLVTPWFPTEPQSP
jgi:hypothetical protein